MQFYGIHFMHPFKQYNRQCLKKSIKHILPPTKLLILMHVRNTIKLHVRLHEDEHLDVRNMKKTLQLN
jgi:hypothetical protein